LSINGFVNHVLWRFYLVLLDATPMLKEIIVRLKRIEQKLMIGEDIDK